MSQQVSFLRQSGWITPAHFKTPVNIIGCGAVGSNLAMTLARMGACSFNLWDFDTVEAHNLPNQCFLAKHIGMSKVDALTDMLISFNPLITVNKFNQRLQPEDAEDLEGAVFLAVDSLEARLAIAEHIVNESIELPLIFDTRLGFDYGETFIWSSGDRTAFEKWKSLTNFKDSEVEDGPCNLKICSTLVLLVVSYIAHQYCAVLTDEQYKPAFNTKFMMKDQLNILSLGV